MAPSQVLLMTSCFCSPTAAAAPWPPRAAPSPPGVLSAIPTPRPGSSGAVVAATPGPPVGAGASGTLPPLGRAGAAPVAASSGLLLVSACPLPLALAASAGPLHFPDAVRNLAVDLLARVDRVSPPDFGGHQTPHRSRRVHHSPVSHPCREEIVLDVGAECC